MSWRWDGPEPRSLLDDDGFTLLYNDMIDLPDAKTLALIAAAPEMLALLRRALAVIQPDTREMARVFTDCCELLARLDGAR